MSKTVNSANTGKPVTAQRASASRRTTSVPQGNTPDQGSARGQCNTRGQGSARGQCNTRGQGSTRGQSNTPDQGSTSDQGSALSQSRGAAQPTTAQASSKTYVGVCVYIDVDGTIKPERIALGNRLFGISSVVDVKDVLRDDGNNQGGRSNDDGGERSSNLGSSNIITKDYTVEIWNGKGKMLTSHLFMENSGNRIRWYVMQKAKVTASV